MRVRLSDCVSDTLRRRGARRLWCTGRGLSRRCAQRVAAPTAAGRSVAQAEQIRHVFRFDAQCGLAALAARACLVSVVIARQPAVGCLALLCHLRDSWVYLEQARRFFVRRATWITLGKE